VLQTLGERGVLFVVGADELAQENEGVEVAGRDPAAPIPGRKEQPPVDLPAVPARPGNEAREDREEPQRRR